MEEYRKEIIQTYGNKIRVRVCGVLLRDSEILLVKHITIGAHNWFYAPPGGGIDFGESSEASLIREFQEETGLTVRIKRFLFVHEYLNSPLHAIELFFEVEETGGTLLIGKDPEMHADKQIIKEVKFWSFAEIQKKDSGLFHNVFRLIKTDKELLQLKGYFIQKGNN